MPITIDETIFGEPVQVQNVGGVAGLPALDGSLLTNVPRKTGNTVWVDKVNGNDGTGTRGRQESPFLTISAAITAATAGDCVLVLPGTYNETLTMKSSVSVIGFDAKNCIIQSAASATETVITMSDNLRFESFTININPSAGTSTGLSFTGTNNSTSCLFRLNVVANPTGSGVVNLLSDAGTGTADVHQLPTAFSCAFATLATAANSGTAYTRTSAATGTSVFRGCTFDGNTGTGVSNAKGTTYYFGCRISGTTPFTQTAGTPTTYLDRSTTLSGAPNITSGTFGAVETTYATRDNYAATVDPTVNDDLTKGYAIGSGWVNTTTKAGFNCVAATTGAAVWAVGSGGTGGALGSSQVVDDTSDTTTTSTTDVVTTSMTITPIVGTYQVWFSGSMENSGGATLMYASIWSGGVQAAASERRQKLSSGQVVPFACQAQVTVNGSQAIEGRWRTQANTATMHQRSLLITRLS